MTVAPFMPPNIPNMPPRLIALLCLPALCLSALPPGFEEELYCPQDQCLRRKQVQRRYTGPRASFYECYDRLTGHTQRPFPWGVKVNPEIRDGLTSGGWHRTECAKDVGHPIHDLLGARAFVLI